MEPGIRILYNPADGNAQNSPHNHAIDIVAIHGIGADMDNTWRESVDNPVNWLSDINMLPKDVPNARIMRFGYRSAWYGTSTSESGVPRKTFVADVALGLLKQLQIQREGITCPIIFIAHSFGGLVLVRALRRSFEEPNRWSNLFKYTAGLITLGTPFRGREGSNLEETVAYLMKENPDDIIFPETMRFSLRDNPYLQDIVQQYMRTREHHPIPLMCYYETEPSPIHKTFKQEKENFAYLVPQDSACLDSSKGIDRYPIHRHHYRMQRFPSPSDEGYLAVKDEIKRMGNGAREYLKEYSVEPQDTPQSHLSILALERNSTKELKSEVPEQKRPCIPSIITANGGFILLPSNIIGTANITRTKIPKALHVHFQDWIQSPNGDNLLLWGRDNSHWLWKALQSLGDVLSHYGHPVIFIDCRTTNFAEPESFLSHLIEGICSLCSVPPDFPKAKVTELGNDAINEIGVNLTKRFTLMVYGIDSDVFRNHLTHNNPALECINMLLASDFYRILIAGAQQPGNLEVPETRPKTIQHNNISQYSEPSFSWFLI